MCSSLTVAYILVSQGGRPSIAAFIYVFGGMHQVLSVYQTFYNVISIDIALSN